MVQMTTDDGYVDEVVGIYSSSALAEAAAERARKRSSGWPVGVYSFHLDVDGG
jgi:hypothetical protein